MYTRIVKNEKEALANAPDLVFPVELAAAFVIGGWERTARSVEEFNQFLKQGLDASPVGEVRLRWKVN